MIHKKHLSRLLALSFSVMTIPVSAMKRTAEDDTHSQELIHAAQAGNITRLQELLSQEGVDINARSRTPQTYGQTALMVAAAHGHQAVVRLLGTHQTLDINATNDAGETAFIQAVEKGHLAVLEELLTLPEKPTDKQQEVAVSKVSRELEYELLYLMTVNIPKKHLPAKGVRAPQRASQGVQEELQERLKKALEIADLEQCKEILAALEDPNDLGEDSENSALMIAVQQGNEALVAQLLAHPSIKIYYKNLNNKTALEIAQEYGNTAIIKLLEVVYERTEALIQAVKKGELSQVKEYIEQGLGADVENKKGVHLLTIAARKGLTDIVRYLLTFASVKINAYPQPYGNKWYGEDFQYTSINTALHKALYNDHQEVAELLLAHPDIDLYKTNADETSILISAVNGIEDTVFLKRLLEQYGLKCLINQGDCPGDTPLSVAIEQSNTAALEALLMVTELDINDTEVDGTTPLIAAVKEGYVEAVSLLLARTDLTVNAQDAEGKDALRHAQENQDESAAHKEILDILQAYLEEKEVMIKPAAQHARLEEDEGDQE